MYSVSKILASASPTASVNTTIYLCTIFTRDLAGLGYGNVCSKLFFIFFLLQYFSISSIAFFSSTLNFILLLISLSPGTKITYRSTMFRTALFYSFVKYFNSFLISIKTSPSLFCFCSAVSYFNASLTVF